MYVLAELRTDRYEQIRSTSIPDQEYILYGVRNASFRLFAAFQRIQCKSLAYLYFGYFSD